MATILPYFTLALVLCLGCIEAQNAAFCPAPNGIFVNPNSRTCRSFIRCTNGIGVFQRCRRGTVFNGQQCIPGNQQTCNRVTANTFNNRGGFGAGGLGAGGFGAGGLGTGGFGAGGLGAGNPNPWGPGIAPQPGVWGTGVQPLPGLWNGQIQNRWGLAGGQGNVGNPWNNGPTAGWNNGALGGAGQFPGVNPGFNPGLLATWVDGRRDLENTEEGDQPTQNANNNLPPRSQVQPNVNRTTQDKRRNWP